MISLTCEDAPSALSLRALERVQKVRKTADGDGTETGVEVCLASEPNGSDGCRRENLLHPLLTSSSARLAKRPNSDGTRGKIGPVLPPLSVYSQSISETECLGYKGFTAGNVPEIIYSMYYCKLYNVLSLGIT